MAKSYQKIKAISLRQKGMSIREIALKLHISKSTASIWCRDIELTNAQKLHLHKNMMIANMFGRMRGAEANKHKKQAVLQAVSTEAHAEIGVSNKRDLLIAGICLFWGEGAKTESRFIFVNSDPDMILLMITFLTDIMRVTVDDIRVNIQINSVHQKRIKEIILFWSQKLGIPHTHFGKPYFINVKSKKVYENHNSYYGIVRLRVLRSSRLQYKMRALVDAFRSSILSA